MTIPIIIIFVLAAVVTGWLLRRRPSRCRHDQIEYFRGWDGYLLPIRLTNRITQQEADVIAEQGGAYLIGYFDADGKLMRDVKMLRGAVFFEHVYEYYPSGKLRRVTVTNTRGEVTTREVAEGTGTSFFW